MESNVWEWEFLSQSLILNDIAESPMQYFPKHAQLEIYRDENYYMYGRLTGQSTESMPHLKQDTSGFFISDFTMQAQDDFFDYQFETPGFLRPSFNSGGEYECHSPIARVMAKKKNTLKEHVFYLSDWYIGRRVNDLFFSCFSQATIDESAKIKHRPHQSLNPDIFDKTYGAIQDHFVVTLKNYTFVVQKINKEYSPTFAHGFALKFSQRWGKIPNSLEREALAEIVGFFLGSQLIQVGSNSYSEQYEIIESLAQWPMAPNPRARCKGAAFAPVSKTVDRQRISEQLALCIPTYLEKRDILNLNGFFHLYWLGVELPAGIDIPIFSTALEMLANAFKKALSTGQTGLYLPLRDFNTIFQDELESIDKKIKQLSIPEADKNAMLNKFKNAYQRGHAQTLKGLYQYLGITPTKVEKEALAQRNKMTHGGTTKNRSELERQVLYAKVCRSFLNRVVLKILGYQGEYIDFSTQGHPSLPIEQGIPDPV